MKKVFSIVVKTILLILALFGIFLSGYGVYSFIHYIIRFQNSGFLGEYLRFNKYELLCDLTSLVFEIGYIVLLIKNGFAKTLFNIAVVGKENIREAYADFKQNKKKKQKEKLEQKLSKLESDE